MASLSTALNYAVAGLRVTSAQTALVSRNISNAGDPDYVKKSAGLTRLPDGSISVASYNRSADSRLLDKLLSTSSGAAGKQATLDALARLSATIGDPESDSSITALVAALQTSLQTYEADPGNVTLAGETVRRAGDLATGLNQASQAVQDTRLQADQDMATSVDRINSLLSQFKVANDAVVRGTGSAADLTDSLDQRDRILKQLSEEIGIRTTTRANNDIAIYTDGGVTLFETNARAVTFEPSQTLTPGVSGNAVYVDGVKITGVPSVMPSRSGRLQALAELRDKTTVTYQAQLDEVARGLIEAFAESDQSGGGGPDLAGLFTYSGGPDLLTGGTLSPGLASDIRVNNAVDPTKGGSLSRLRDGGINGADYVYNATGAASFADRLNTLVSGLTDQRAFDAESALQSPVGILDFSTSSVDWLEGRRQTATTSVDYQNTLVARASEALSNAQGVNLDDEYARQLQLEQTYAASAKLIGVIDDLFNTLLQNVG